MTLVTRYQDRALALVGEALGRLPAGRRASFLREWSRPTRQWEHSAVD